MLIFELVTEGLWASFRQFDDFPQSIGLYLAMFQFLFLAVGALGVKVFKRCRARPISKQDLAPEAAEEGRHEQPTAGRKDLRQVVREWVPYVALSILVFLSTGLANQSVNHVPYVLKVVFKSSKLMPTMLVSTLMGNSESHYNAMEYGAAVCLCLGTAGFAYGSGSHDTGRPLWSLLYGCFLLMTAVLADAFIPNAQQKVMAQRVSPEDLMLRTNILGTGLLLAMMAATGELYTCVVFTMAHPAANINLVLCGITLFTAVFCMTSLVNAAGSVFAVTIGTARKGASVVLSYLIFPKELTSVHAVSLASVAAGVVLHEYNSQRKKRLLRLQGVFNRGEVKEG